MSKFIEPPFSGEWRHGNGYLICGTLRIAVQNFDSDPSETMKKEVFDWICQTLNQEQRHFTRDRFNEPRPMAVQ